MDISMDIHIHGKPEYTWARFFWAERIPKCDRSDGNKIKMLRPIQDQDHVTARLQMCRPSDQLQIWLARTIGLHHRQRVTRSHWQNKRMRVHNCLISLITYLAYIIRSPLCSAVGSVGNGRKYKTKAARPCTKSPRPGPISDRSCHKTAVSDLKTGDNQCNL